MREIYLVRHGETDWNITGQMQGLEDNPLNETGLAQAAKVAAAFEGIGIQRVISSKLQRAFNTAEIIAKKLGLPSPDVVEDLHERDYGLGGGLTREQATAKFPDGVPGEESKIALRERSVKAFYLVAAKFKESKILVVGHGSMIRTLLGHFMGQSPEQTAIMPVNCSISKMMEDGDGWALSYMNIGPEDLKSHET